MSFAVLRVLVAAALVAAHCAAQSFTGRIYGTVTDPLGAVIPSAEIKITHLGTSRTLVVTSESNGNYAAGELPPGEYALEVSARGFKKFLQRGILVDIQRHARVDVTLQVGEVTESIEVVADAPMLETTQPGLSKVVDNRRIVSLPLNSRNVYTLLYLTPGVTGSVSSTYTTGFAINGARTSMLDILVDGVSTAHPTVNGFSGNSTFPPVDAIAEFRVLGTNYSAEFGRSNGGVVNVVYKSGTNELHGSAFEFLRNSALDANDFFANRLGQPLGSFKRNQFGAHLAGPIRRDKLFFLASYEALRQRSFASTTTSVPTLLERQGDFSQTLAANGRLVQIFDPFTTRRNPSGSGFIRDPFPGNVIPPVMQDPVARNVIRYYPEPNTPGDPVTKRNNYFATGARRFDQNQLDGRVDYNLTTAQRLFGRFSWRDNLNAPPALFPGELAIAEGRVNEGVHQPSAALDYSNTLNPTTILTARLGFSRSLFMFDNQGLGFRPSSLGLPSAVDSVVDRWMFPRFGASGYVNLGGNDHRWNAFMTYTALANMTKIRGDHAFKFGWEGRLIRVNVWEARAAGTFNFSAGFTQGPDPNRASANAGNSIASLLLGTGTTGNTLIRNWKNVASQSFYHGWYF